MEGWIWRTGDEIISTSLYGFSSEVEENVNYENLFFYTCGQIYINLSSPDWFTRFLWNRKINWNSMHFSDITSCSNGAETKALILSGLWVLLSKSQKSLHLGWQVNAINEQEAEETNKAPGPLRSSTENNLYCFYSLFTHTCSPTYSWVLGFIELVGKH